MRVQFYTTKCKLLQPWLEGYYFLSKDDCEDDVEYLTFPNNFVNLSVSSHVNVVFNETEAVITEDCSKNISSVLVVDYKKPIKVKYIGEINELTFHFNPLGLNAFLPNPILSYEALFKEFYPYIDFIPTMLSILKETDVELKIDKIENYWLTKLSGFQHAFMINIIEDILLSNSEVSINELALKYNTSRQNIYKSFKNFLGKGPSDFLKIHRFRETLSNRIASLKSEGNLTALSYESFFYDQSHMIKEFRALTGLSPKKFFANIQLKKGAGNWLFAQ